MSSEDFGLEQQRQAFGDMANIHEEKAKNWMAGEMDGLGMAKVEALLAISCRLAELEATIYARKLPG